ncbi:MAG TPA: hypoxanthine phosphoribosyltransferase [Mesorhizobium sp.]|jgi:hypoxanthine phosphoribosyltransferase|nr:hypoxanthine phosphoribosyltransferase [Mesorhizobium sp.]
MLVVRGKKIEVLFSASTIARRNLELAKEIAAIPAHDLLVVSVLKGSFIFAADLIRAMHDAGSAPEVEFIFISSYGAGTTGGEVRLLRDIDNDVRGRDLLLIDDILESGRTLLYTRDLMLSRGARSCRIAVLLDKRMRRKSPIEADHVGFDCPDHFVVGYGMDVAHAFRELPFVGIVRGEAEPGEEPRPTVS